MLSMEEFKSYVVGNIQDYLPSAYNEAKISINTVTKNNGLKLEGLEIQKTGDNVVPTVYLDSFYDEYAKGTDLDQQVGRIADTFIDNLRPGLNMSLSDFFNYESISDKIVGKLINTEKNLDLLAGCPSKQFEDLSMIYEINTGLDSQSRATAKINDNMMEKYGVDVDDLHEKAMENMVRDGVEFMSLSSVLTGMVDEPIPLPEVPGMYVLSNHERVSGSAVIMVPEVQEMIADKLGSDYYVIPSSIHEVLILSGEYDEAQAEEIADMVKYVNETQVEPYEVLSENAYHYNGETKQLKIANKAMVKDLNTLLEERGLGKSKEEKPEIIKHEEVKAMRTPKVRGR